MNTCCTSLQKQNEFATESNQLLNQICDTFHNELKTMADKYGNIHILIKVEE